MMKLIINSIELFVLVVFSEPSVAMPPMLSGCVSSTASIHSHSYYQFDLSVKSPSASITKHEYAKLTLNRSHDDTKFEYSFVTSNNENILENKGRNTDIVFFFNTKMQIYAKGNVDVLYTLEFQRRHQATTFANHIISTTPSRYKKCQGSNSYKIEKLYDSTRPNDLDMVDNWCIFKERKADVTTFMIKRIGAVARNQDPIGVFRPNDYELRGVPGADNRLELGILFNRAPLNPKYILETSTPETLVTFLK